MVPTTVPQLRHPPWLLTGSLGLVSLLSNATMEMLRLPLPISRAFALGSASDTPECFLFLGDRERKARSRSWTLISRYGPSPAVFRGDRRL